MFYRINIYNFTNSSYNALDMPHQGEILQNAIKNSGISITRIVDELGITRPTIYRKFKDDTLDYEFVKKIGDIIGHDFSQDFTKSPQSVLSFVTNTPTKVSTHPALQRNTSAVTPSQDQTEQLLALQTKYIALLEAYNELLIKVYGPK
ncbi:helix-turn-helix domain-containing protein [Hymenobacter sp. NBH84]|uniref:helix-turn-helix domain-containing protein n=1 Tax=Hymenobacter sp. NBH84 TaxID=2596915 RepID=UPI001628768A|nr:helix-turn-helix domain-containing protein [Hymenobacter sp. NBH84]QNE41182.1 helix-turn-helix domain-containing protein [Hymenobacter sp. NBH84]